METEEVKQILLDLWEVVYSIASRTQTLGQAYFYEKEMPALKEIKERIEKLQTNG